MVSVLDFRLNEETGDVRSLLGMNTRAAWAIAALFLGAEIALFTTSAGELTAVWPGAVLLAILTVWAVGLISVRQDPLPAPFALAVAIAATAATYACFHALPVPNSSPDQLWMFGGVTTLSTWLCVRGRVGTAWLTMAGLMASAVLWTVTTDRGPMEGLGTSAVNLGPLLMATFFAATIRPAAANIYELRRRAVEQNAARAAAVAAVAERDQRLRELGMEVTPLLQRIAGDSRLTLAEREQCRTVEAQIRDSLRAPLLAGTPQVSAAVSAARGRGVEVVMVDEHGLDDVDPPVRTSVLGQIVAVVNATARGSIVIRILPPGRPLFGTIVLDDSEDVTRVELLPDGAGHSTMSNEDESAVLETESAPQQN